MTGSIRGWLSGHSLLKNEELKCKINVKPLIRWARSSSLLRHNPYCVFAVMIIFHMGFFSSLENYVMYLELNWIDCAICVFCLLEIKRFNHHSRAVLVSVGYENLISHHVANLTWNRKPLLWNIIWLQTCYSQQSWLQSNGNDLMYLVRDEKHSLYACFPPQHIYHRRCHAVYSLSSGYAASETKRCLEERCSVWTIRSAI